MFYYPFANIRFLIGYISTCQEDSFKDKDSLVQKLLQELQKVKRVVNQKHRSKLRSVKISKGKNK